MNALIAISSCQLYQERCYNQSARATWIPAIAGSGLDYKFFHGHGAEAKADVILLDCPDDYFSLCYKTLESLKWAYAQGYEHVFRAYPDTYVVASRLQDSGFANFDYVGNFEGGSMTAAGGPGYWLSRRAIARVLENHVSPTHPNIGSVFEDRWVGVLMNRHRDEFTRSDDHRYAEGTWLRGHTPLKHNDLITAHLWGGEGQPNPETFTGAIYEVHEKWLRSWA